MGIAEVWTSLNAVIAGETDRPCPDEAITPTPHVWRI
jgi:hypothetical protein